MAPVRWGFLGAGHIATASMAPAVHDASGATLHAVASRSPDRAAALQPAVVHASYADLVADPDVDAVYVALTNAQHLPETLRALGAGKPVLCEKPLGRTAAEVATMVEASETSGVRLVEASWYRWHPRVRLAAEVLRRGDVGRVRHVSAGFTFPGVPAGDYRLDPALGGGALLDIGCYAVSAALWAVADGLPNEVVSRQTLSATGVDLSDDLILGWHTGVEAEISVAMNEPARQWLIVTGDRGEVELRESPFTAAPGQETELWVSDGRRTSRLQVAPANAYQLMLEDVSAVLQDRPGWVLPLAESFQTARVLDAAAASARAGGSTVAP